MLDSVRFLLIVSLLAAFTFIRPESLSAQTAQITAAPTLAGSQQKTTQAKKNDLLFHLKRNGVFEIFLQAIEKSGWLEKLSKNEIYTVFAPSDAAFAHVESTPRELIFSDKAILKSFVEQHIALGIVDLKQLENSQNITTISGIELLIEKKQPITIAQAPLIKSDIVADNGMIHVLGLARTVQDPSAARD